MKSLLILIFLGTLSFSAEKFQSVQANSSMSWHQAVRFCFNIGGRLPNVDQVELAYRYKKTGIDVDYLDKIYWTRTDINMEAAMSFDFSSGLAFPDHKSNRYKVMCVR